MGRTEALDLLTESSSSAGDWHVPQPRWQNPMAKPPMAKPPRRNLMANPPNVQEAELVQRLALLEVRIEQEQGDAPNIPLGSTSEEATVATPLISRLSPNKATSRGPRSPLQKFASAGAGLVRSLTRRSMDSPRGLDRALSAVPDAGTASRLDLSGLTQRSLYWSQETGHVIAEREKLRSFSLPSDCAPLSCAG